MGEVPELRVEPALLPWVEALILGDGVFSRRFGVAVASGWCVFPEVLDLALEAARTGNQEWGVYLFFDASDGALVGNGGWKGPPVDGCAEIGYSVAEGRRNRGIATAAVHEFIRAGCAARLERIIAHTLPFESASTSVLRRCGFAMTATDEDPEEGPVWRWELPLAHEGAGSVAG